MKKVLPFILFVFVVRLAFGQALEVTDLKFNPALYFPSIKFQPPNTLPYKYLISSGNIVVKTGAPISIADTAFVDDFSTNRTPYYLALKDSMYDTLYNVVGPCLGPEHVNSIENTFSTVPTYKYYWDKNYQELDSTPLQPIVFSYVHSTNSQCLTDTVQYSLVYWPLPFTYTFDSLSGIVLDSQPSQQTANTIDLIYAPVLYFAVGDTTGTLWFDSYAFINNNFPINPPTIGVATLDGLNQYGLPYNNTTNAGGQADYLTSNQIDLSPYTTNDSVFLSFFFEPGGFGDYPGVGDSLVVEALDQGGFWQALWVDTGYIDSVPDSFQQVLLQLPAISDSGYSFFHAGFQFRFRNVVSVYGLNNMWHIDYVRLGKNRNFGDTIINDMAFQYPFPTVLKNYTLEPGPQVNFPADLADTVFIPVRNLEQTNPATNYVDSAVELYPIPQLVAAPPLQTFNAYPYDTLQIYPATQYHNLPGSGVDSLVLKSQIFLQSGDSRTLNDTIRLTQTFCNIMAYDDGTAEKAFGLSGGDEVKKFAYEFDLNRPDTLVGFQVMFTQADANVHDLVFDFDIWDSLQLNNFLWADTPVASLVNQLPYYVDSMNGFTTYLLDTQYIFSNKVYLGFDQTDSRRLQVGYDMNDTLGHPHMFTYFNGKWDSAGLLPVGSPMIRLIFGHYYGHSSSYTSVVDLTKNKNGLDVFPNPTTGTVYLKSTRAYADYAIDIYNSMGQKVVSLPTVSNQLDINNLANGVYLLNARDLQTGEIFHKRVIKTASR